MADSFAPSLGSLYPFIASQAAQDEYPLSFLQPRFKDHAQWRKEARAKMLELLHYAPKQSPFNAEVVSHEDYGAYTQEKIYFNTTPDIRVPAFVLVPKGLKRKAPAIVALHDHGGYYMWGKEKIVECNGEHSALKDWRKAYGERAIAGELARQGYVVIVIDMFYWGERRLLLEGDGADWRDRPTSLTTQRIQEFNARSGQNEQLVGRSIYSAGFTWPGVIIWDDIRTVDYLCTRPEVDTSRIGAVGLSVGGLRTCYLTALDERIKASVVVGWMASFRRQLHTHMPHSIGFTKVIPGLYAHMDYPDVAAMSAPRALLVINGSKDGLFHLDGVKECFQKLRAVYEKAGVPEKFRGSLYDAPHEFNQEMQKEAWEWLRRWI
ncbi:MAG TPA: alpha/beta hydrolase family protein [Planctomycetota bacterium]|nr:alpha/beta hydrolase family protein [Planctomycetota bacterium]